MAKSAFTFLRATYPRRIRQCRLAWGVNDFDEAYPLPYTSDLVRLATSTPLAIKSDRLEVRPREACDAILSDRRPPP